MSRSEKLPDDLWHDIERVTQRMAEFLAEAQHTAIDWNTVLVKLMLAFTRGFNPWRVPSWS